MFLKRYSPDDEGNMKESEDGEWVRFDLFQHIIKAFEEELLHKKTDKPVDDDNSFKKNN